MKNNTNLISHQIFDYKQQDYVPYEHSPETNSEEICLHFCRQIQILPTTRLLFGLRVFDSETEWAVPSQPLRPHERYCFRMRFKIPALDSQLKVLDIKAFEYLYRQMRYDMVHECITEIRYPAKKDNVMGLGVVDMYIDLWEKRETVERIETNYEKYVPRKLVKAHKVFVKPKICKSFREFRNKRLDLNSVIWNYIHEVNTLAPDYLMETFTATVDHIPNDLENGTHENATRNSINNVVLQDTPVYLKMHINDTSEPHVKIAKVTSINKLKWILLTKFEDIYAVVTNEDSVVQLEINGFPNSYYIKFRNNIELESFVTYLSGYTRLTSKWMLDLCDKYKTPSLEEMINLRVHGPIGGNFSFKTITEKNNSCGSYIIRQCEKDYDTYYIDINTKSSRDTSKKWKTETFKIRNENSKWILDFNDSLHEFDNLHDLAQFIPTETNQKFCIRPSPYDKPPILLICVPKNLHSKKTDMFLSDAELQNKRVQIFHPKKDLQWYKNSECDCDNGKMKRIRADWILPGSYKDVCVTLKVLKSNSDFPEFMKLADTWSKIYSPQCIKLYGITLSTPYTMIMEFAEYGPLDKFLLTMDKKINLNLLQTVVLNLVRGIIYLLDRNIIHGYIRCSNLFVTKYDAQNERLESKIGDSGFPRHYNGDDLPWIPFEYHNKLDAARHDTHADLWAFSTTIWEIFSRGKPIENRTEKALRQCWNQTGGILPRPDECPIEMYHTMMDGWSLEPEKRFNHPKIFENLSKKPVDNYYSVKSLDDKYGETSSTYSDGSDLTETLITNGIGSSSYIDVENQSFHFSNNSVAFPRNKYLMSASQNYFDEISFVKSTPDGKVVYKKLIGEGHYGKVYLGDLYTNNGQKEAVAIKVLKTDCTQIKQKDYLREIEIMKALDHPNIVKIKHWLDDDFSIIMEYVEGGSFYVYLQSEKPNLTNKKLLRYALDIAKGMDCLRNKKIIHRDLAARNILLDYDRVKISDFGLAQFANSEGFYQVKSDRKIPIKWYSPESLKTQKFSFQSDVWSYGITLFEMFSRGEEPNLDPKEDLLPSVILDRLEKGERLRKPLLCPDEVYEKLMLSCWHADPNTRPTFENIIEIIHLIKMKV